MAIPHEADPRRPKWVAALVSEHARALCAYVSSLGCPTELVEDVVQDTFLIVLDQGFAERSTGHTRAYLRRVARNRFLQADRRERRGGRVDLDAIDAVWSRFDRDDDGASYLAALEQCLQLLPERSREVLRMRYQLALGRDEIAARCSLSLGGIKSLLLRCKAELRRCVEGRLAE